MHPLECVGEHIGTGMAAVHQTVNKTLAVPTELSQLSFPKKWICFIHEINFMQIVKLNHDDCGCL